MKPLLSVDQRLRRRCADKALQWVRNRLMLPIALALYLCASALMNHAHAFECQPVQQLTARQVGVLVKAYHAGRHEGFGYSLAAIAWQESLAGIVNVNAADPSFGIYHISLDSAADREGITNGFQRNMLAQRLLDDDDYAAYHAIQELKFWQEKHNGDWMRMWASYNGGWNWQYTGHYAAAIAEKIRLIKTCLILN